MDASPSGFTRYETFVLLPSFLVDTNESLRQRALRLVTHGVSQKVLAGKMGMTPSTFSRWLNQREGINPASVTALDGFNAFVHELSAVLFETDLDSIRQPGVSESRNSEPAAGKSARRDTTQSDSVRGDALATSKPGSQHGQGGTVPGPARQTDRRLFTEVERLTRTFEEADGIRRPARAPGSARQHAAAPGGQKAAHRPRARKPHR
jgi:transcriptional regulator with XRE-family HTH domain